MRKDNKNILIAALLFAIIAMSIGYAAFASTLNINGSAKIDGDWNVSITDIISTPTGDATDNTSPSYSALTANFDALLKKPGDAMTYTITIENKGNIDAKLNTITLTPNEEESSISYSVENAPNEGDVLLAGETTTVVVRVEYRLDAKVVDSNPREFTGTIEYVQN